MESQLTSAISSTGTHWYTEEFIYDSVAKYLKSNGYKIQKDHTPKEGEAEVRKIVATKFFKKEVIEVKGFPYSHHNHITATKSAHARSWFSEAMVNSFTNFSILENEEIAMALPNVGRYQAIIEKLYDYFTFNDLYFRIYLVNEDGSVEVSNLNQKHTQ